MLILSLMGETWKKRNTEICSLYFDFALVTFLLMTIYTMMHCCFGYCLCAYLIIAMKTTATQRINAVILIDHF
jgi:hypothetical protein